MSDSAAEAMLELLEMRLDTFSMCEINTGCALKAPRLENIVIHYVMRGEGVLQGGTFTLALRAGMVVIIPRGCAKYICGPAPGEAASEVDDCLPNSFDVSKPEAWSKSSGLVVACASFDPRIGSTAGLLDHLHLPILTSAPSDTVGLIFHAALSELSHPGLGSKAIASTMMKQVVLMLLRAHLDRESVGIAARLPILHPQLGHAVAAIVALPGDPHCLSSLAKLAGMSRSRFTHHFAATYGSSVMDYLKGVRLSKAKQLLLRTDLPVKTIAANVGFASRSHFSRAFRVRFGADPTSFRAVGDCGSREAPTVADESAAELISAE